MTLSAVDHGSRYSRLVAWTLVGLYVVVLATTLWMDQQVFGTYIPEAADWMWLGFHGPWLGPFVFFAVMGAAIVSQRPRNRVGWMMLASALGVGIGEAIRTSLYFSDPSGFSILGVLVPYASSIMLSVGGILLGIAFVPLVFPEGQLPSPRWRWLVWVGVLAIALLGIRATFSPVLDDQISFPGGSQVTVYEVPNPIGSADLAGAVEWLPPEVLMVVVIVGAAAAVVMRFRRSTGVRRQQMKWFVLAAGLVALAVAGILVLRILRSGIGLPELLIIGLGLSAYPVAIGVAVLRYRLYDIDRLISRTVSYGLVIAILALLYIAVVAGLGAAASAVFGADDNDLIVAISTLVVIAAFRPLRTRIQTLVDQRFNRTGYEARQAVERFGSAVRDEVDLDEIRIHVANTAIEAVQPNQAWVWLSGDHMDSED